MRDMYYNFDEQKFREYTQKRYKSAQGWKKLNAISMALVILGILFVFMPVMPVILVGNSEFLVKAILFGAGLLCSVVPFCVAYIVRSKATRKYGKPYEEMQKIFLYSNDSGIQFGYHDKSDRDEPASVNVYQIAYSNIVKVEYIASESTYFIYGRVELLEYEDMSSNRIKHSYTKGQFGDFSRFSFFDCFDKASDFEEILREHNIDVKKR